MKKYNRYHHEDWVVALWIGFAVMWFGVSFTGLAYGIIVCIMAAFK